MFRRKRKQPWYTYPIAFVAVVYGVIQAERHSHLIWSRVVKPEAWHQLLKFLDKRFPPKSQRRQREHPRRSMM